ncbi:hypothetical protein BN2475_190235 [Paraburkholderia ribeironis]|uniref:Uncharacterized protein n=1 Tax=Paraburkholderia ribeironis TaxID=1247936 RepID=A0A1N7RXE1_9BURK|nr:hypothetical protein BN2475_190235 [Paraburkholderia ribeironis]
MSEYPSTGIDKAILKFVLQDRKKSQIVSVKVAVFFCVLFGNCYRKVCSKVALPANPSS